MGAVLSGRLWSSSQAIFPKSLFFPGKSGYLHASCSCFSIWKQLCYWELLFDALPSLSAFNTLRMTIFMLEECLLFVNYYSWMFFLRFDSLQQFDIYFALFLDMIIFVNKGFRSRVKYFSIVDPTQTTYYISEILDAGLQGPLFMVTRENCPGEVFINVSPTKCWSMVRERLNMEIRKQLSMGRANLPTLQPPGPVDGLEMFGLLSPVIVQVRKSQAHLS